MTNEVSVSIYLDQRRQKESGKYPLKLRVFHSRTKKRKLFPTMFDLTSKEFEASVKAENPRGKNKELKEQVEAIKAKAVKVVNEIEVFTFEQFEKRMYRKATDGTSVKYHYKCAIAELKKRDQVSTMEIYSLAEKSFIAFLKKYSKGSFEKLTFFDVTVDWLKDYEYYMLTDKNRSVNTLSIYVRTLRTVFNNAIAAKDIQEEFYPFGKRKYQVPSKLNKKKALSEAELKALYFSKPITPEQQKAKDFWFLIYNCSGINVKDLARLRFRDIKNDKFSFYRAKTSLTSKEKLIPIEVHLNEFSAGIIEKYKRKSNLETDYIFQIIENSITPEEEKKRIKNFTRFINQHIKKLAKANNITEDISTYWARHSFATKALRKGESMEFVQESLGHKNIKTTQNYFAGFEDETKKAFANKLMDFD